MHQQIEKNAGVERGREVMRPDLVHVFGCRESLSLDARMRFRLPGHLSSVLSQEIGRAGAGGGLSPAARQSLAFYFVPGTRNRIFLYPAQNIQVAIQRFERPPRGVDEAELRAARDYFYSMMEFVEADRQNRLQIPEHLCEHAELNPESKRIVLVAHNLWLSVSSAASAEQLQAGGRKAFDHVGADVLDPVVSGQEGGGGAEAPGELGRNDDIRASGKDHQGPG